MENKENKNETGLSITKEGALESVTQRLNELQKTQKIALPKNYSPQNALNSAWLMLQDVKNKNGDPALKVCTRNSIIEAFYNMVIQALSPAKHQCYFIVRGDKLYCDKSYFGTIASAKRMGGVKNVVANVIYQDDVFEYQLDLETGEKKITKHEQKLENIDINKIKGAYAIVIPNEGENHVEIMTMAQIKAAWNQGPMHGNSGAHKNFADQMCKKTVLSRACKLFVNTSDDSDLFAEAFNTESYAVKEDTEQEISKEVKENANKKVIDIDPDQMEKVEDEPKKQGNKPSGESKSSNEIKHEKVEQQCMEGPNF